MGYVQGARNIYALAARVLYGAGCALHSPVRQGRAKLNSAVQTGVSGQGNNHAIITSTPAPSSA